ncbi:MAG: mechanosensitive ion channel [Clostridia bacterium]|nr:mechanosensitive ion channel [Clostridia bacterium]
MEWLWEQLKEYALSAGFRLVAAVLIIVIGFKLSSVLVKGIGKTRFMKKADPTAGGFIKSFLSLAIKSMIVISAIAILGVPMSSLVTLLASAGVAIGLAVQGALSNLAGGLMILLFKPFKVGDFITYGEHSGTVRTIGVFYTEIRTIDNRIVTAPNGGLTNSVTVNYSVCDLRRVDMKINASYNNDTDEVRNTLLALVQKTPGTLADPAPAVVITGFAENGIEYSIRVWCRSEDYWNVYFGITDKLKKVFDATGIEIPYPQVDVHLKEQK